MSFRVTSIGIPNWPVHAKTTPFCPAIAISLNHIRSPVDLNCDESRVLAPGDKTALASNYGLTGLGCVKGTFLVARPGMRAMKDRNPHGGNQRPEKRPSSPDSALVWSSPEK